MNRIERYLNSIEKINLNEFLRSCEAFKNAVQSGIAR